MMNDDDVVVARASGREAVEELRRSGALDALFERLDAGEVEMTGSQGLLPGLSCLLLGALVVLHVVVPQKCRMQFPRVYFKV